MDVDANQITADADVKANAAAMDVEVLLVSEITVASGSFFYYSSVAEWDAADAVRAAIAVVTATVSGLFFYYSSAAEWVTIMIADVAAAAKTVLGREHFPAFP